VKNILKLIKGQKFLIIVLSAMMIFAACGDKSSGDPTSPPTKVVSVAIQGGAPILEGTGGTATFSVITANIAAGTYNISVGGLPAGVNAPATIALNAVGAGSLSLTVGADVEADDYDLTLTIDGTTSDEFTLEVLAPGAKGVSAAWYSGTMTAGLETSGTHVRYKVDTVDIDDGTYTTTVKQADSSSLPQGVSLASNVEIINNSGWLTLVGGNNTLKGEYSLTLTIDGTTSTAFGLSIAQGTPSITGYSTSSGIIMEDVGGTKTWTINTKNIDAGTAASIEWCNSTGTASADAPAGLSGDPVITPVASDGGNATVTLSFGEGAVKGEYYFKATIASTPEVVSPAYQVTVADDTSPGSGTTGDPFKVRSPEDLAKVGKETGAGNWTLTAHYFQMNDIVLSGNWTPIGTTASRFYGSYDGGGYTISGLSITASSGNQGLFGFIGTDGTVKNLTLSGIDVEYTGSSSEYVGGVVGYNQFGTVQNCHVSGSIKGYVGVGGVAGFNQGGTVQNCHVSGSIEGYINLGGVAGSNSGTIEYCSVSDSSVTGTGGSVGGVVGNNSGPIQNCYAVGVSVNSSSGSYFGGIVGYSNDKVESCVALNGSINRNNGTTGRIVGSIGSSGTLENNYADEDMTMPSGYTVSSDADGKDGADVEAADFNTKAWWINDKDSTPSGPGFDFDDVWDWDDDINLPVLR